MSNGLWVGLAWFWVHCVDLLLLVQLLGLSEAVSIQGPPVASRGRDC